MKQQYGIHLARRLQSDDAGKQANWADIDDDDEDWAPNTMEWADGTKVTLPQVDETPVSSVDPLPEATPVNNLAHEPSASKEKIAEPVKPKSPSPTKILPSPTVKTTGFLGKAGLVLKGATELPALAAKTSGPATSVKSPWAPIPPIEKVAPISVDTSTQQQFRQSRLGHKDVHSFQGLPQPPAKEIAADDFRRTWRDAPNASRELYNAQSGRYEPANEKRRSSTRNEIKPLQPAVLQRSHQDGPAEPSPAFQTHRAGGQENYTRHRTSSNVSGGSEKMLRKMSRGEIPPPHESLDVRRGSLAAVSDEPASPNISSPLAQNPYQRSHQSQSWQSRVSPSMSYQSPQLRHAQTIASTIPTAGNQNQNTPSSYEDPFEIQKKAMQVKRELAIARRREEEAKEEAERKERIRIKLASMGPSPEKFKKEQIQEKTNQTQIQARDPENSPADDTQKKTEVVLNTNLDTSESKDKKSIISTVDSNPVEKHHTPEARPNGNHISQSSSPQNQSSQDTRSSQSWHSNSSERFKPWAPAPSQPSATRNVWGPPTNDRTLGNGTFNPELSRVPEISTHPGPIGPPNQSRVTSHGHGCEYCSRPAPIGPPNRRQGNAISQDPKVRAAVTNSGWGSLPNKIAADDARLVQRQEIEISRMRDLREKGVLSDPSLPAVHDTWRQVSVKEDGSRSKIQKNSITVHNEETHTWQNQEQSAFKQGNLEQQDIAQRRSLDKISTQPQLNNAWETSKVNSPPVRDSRFFPNKDNRLEVEDQASFNRPDSPSPPPPTQQGHPAYDGDITHPHVSLPRPPPVVKLPPPKFLAPIGPPKPTSFAAAVATPVIPAVYRTASRIQPKISQSRELRREESVAGNWQDRIDSLIGRKSSPSKPQSMAVDSSSKNALEVSHLQISATVSLPSRVSGDFAIDIGSVETKPASEICFEEQEMGSLPPVRMPSKPPIAAWDLAPSPKPLTKQFLISQTTSIEPITFPPTIAKNNLTVTIKIPGHFESKNISVQLPKQKSSPRRGGLRIGTTRHYLSSPNQRGRGREILPGSSVPNTLDRTVVTSEHNLSSRNRGRGQGNSWKRNSNISIQT